LAHEGSLRRRPRFVCKEGAALDALMAARSRRRGYFPLPRTAADICVRTVRKGPAIRFQVAAADGPGRTIHCVRLPSTAGQLAKPLEHKGLSLARIMRTVRTVENRSGHRERRSWLPIATASEPRSSWRCAGTTSTSPQGACTCAGPRAGMPVCIRYRAGKAEHSTSCSEAPTSPYVFMSERRAPLSVAGYQRMVARAGRVQARQRWP
jgi:hypothetical protein